VEEKAIEKKIESLKKVTKKLEDFLDKELEGERTIDNKTVNEKAML
jgi:hypothetical protein